MEFSRWKNLFVVLLLLLALAPGIVFVAKKNGAGLSQAGLGEQVLPSAKAEYGHAKKLANPPQIVKAVYLTGYSAGTKAYLKYLESFLEGTQINAVVVDIKGSDGRISYNSLASEAKKYGLYSRAIANIDDLINYFHGKNLYVIGRIAVFEDPAYAKARPELAIKSKDANGQENVLWQDRNGLNWLDPSLKDVWDYNIALAKDALSHGFDEVNFDYVRFPSDGDTSKMQYPFFTGQIEKRDVIKVFFAYLRSQLEGEKISADLFGQTTVNKDDMGIGQVMEDSFGNFDYVAPMVYPSHYAKGFGGYEKPAEHPYQIIRYSMDKAVQRIKEANVAGQVFFRPWIQDFNMGAEYDAFMVKEQIRALQDSLGENYKGFMLWNPSNIYTKEAVLSPAERK